jgi:alcohol dehydrogenase class IV
MKANPEKFRNITMFLRDEHGTAGKYAIEDSIDEVKSLIHDIELDVPLSRQGLKEKDVERAADGVINYMGGSITNDPAMPKREDIINIIRQSF